MFKVPNLDHIGNDSTEYRILAKVFIKLSNYCEYDARRMDYIRKGDIDEAKYTEKLMKEEYDSLPEWARW